MSSKVIEIPAPSKYGAIEIKKYINKATLRGFTITIVAFIILMLAYSFWQGYQQAQAMKKKKMAPVVKLKLENLPPPDAAEDAPPPPPTQQIVNHGPAARAGTPVPVPDTEITADLQEFADVDVLARASAEGGDGIDLGTMASNIDVDAVEEVNVEVKEEEPDMNEFIPVEKEPNVDYAELQKKIVYPDMAKRAGVEGNVYIRVLVDKTGKVVKTVVQASDHTMLEKAAVNAIKKCQFTPAIQNGRPIMCWVTIPVEFSLR